MYKILLLFSVVGIVPIHAMQMRPNPAEQRRRIDEIVFETRSTSGIMPIGVVGLVTNIYKTGHERVEQHLRTCRTGLDNEEYLLYLDGRFRETMVDERGQTINAQDRFAHMVAAFAQQEAQKKAQYEKP